MFTIIGRPILGKVAMHVADDLLHVTIVVVGQIGLLLVPDLDEAVALIMADAGADGAAVVGLQPLLQLGGGHVDRLVEILPCLFPVVLVGHPILLCPCQREGGDQGFIAASRMAV